MMSSKKYPPLIIIDNIINHFFTFRNFKLTSFGDNKASAIPQFTDEEIMRNMDQFGFVRIDALDKKDNLITFLVLNAHHDMSKTSAQLRKLIDSISPKSSNGHALREVFIIVGDEFMQKKNMTESIDSYKRNSEEIEYRLFKYEMFISVKPNHNSVPKHEIITQEEFNQIATTQYFTAKDLPIILYNDPIIVWIGAKRGDIIKITRDSQTAAITVIYRRVQ